MFVLQGGTRQAKYYKTNALMNAVEVTYVASLRTFETFTSFHSNKKQQTKFLNVGQWLWLSW